MSNDEFDNPFKYGGVWIEEDSHGNPTICFNQEVYAYSKYVLLDGAAFVVVFNEIVNLFNELADKEVLYINTGCQNDDNYGMMASYGLQKVMELINEEYVYAVPYKGKTLLHFNKTENFGAFETRLKEVGMI